MEWHYVFVTFIFLLKQPNVTFGQNDALAPVACNRNLTIDTTGRVLHNGFLEAGGHTFKREEYVELSKRHYRVCICAVEKCLRKCCPEGQFLNRTCQPSDTNLLHPFAPDFYSQADVPDPWTTIKNFTVVYGDTCPYKRYRLEPFYNEEDTTFLLNIGELFMPYNNKSYRLEQFCVDVTPVTNETLIAAFLCFDAPPSKDINILYPIGMIISIPFLVATFLVYALIPELRNLHGRSLMCHVASLTTAYIFLSIAQIYGSQMVGDFCLAAAYILQFSFLSAFFWMNVMSFDIWWVFSGFRGFRGSVREREHKKFLLYSAYAWGGPLVIMIVSMIMDFVPGISEYVVKPNFGVQSCWFATQLAVLAYFYGPIAVLLLCNLVLFCLTAVKIFSVKRETRFLHSGESRRHDDANDNKQRFILYMKLFLVMGINWVMEVISWAAEGPSWLWYITDLGNTLQGIFIFIIFVCKPRIKRLFLARFFPKYLPPDITSSVKTATSSVMSRNSSTISKSYHDSVQLDTIDRNSVLKYVNK